MALIECKECKKEVSSEAKTCPNCGFDLQKETNKKKSNIGCIVAIVLIGIIFLIIQLSPSSNESNKAMEAFIVSQDFVSSELKTPSEAEYPTFNDSFVTISGNIYTIRSYVDSQNSFGANIRSSYTCILKFENDLFYLQSVNIN
jgi:hypothetical protein